MINSLSAAQSAETLEEYGITHIISVASRPPSIPEELQIKHKYYEIHDDHKADLLAVLPEAVMRLDWILKNGDCGLDGKGGRSKVLVHCCMGKSRSGAIVVGYGLSLLFVGTLYGERRCLLTACVVMKLEKYSYEQALEKVKEQRHIVRPNSHFVELLRAWGRMRFSPWCGEDLPKPKKKVVESGWVEIEDGGEDEWEM